MIFSAILNEYLKKIDWTQFDAKFRGGLCLFPQNDIGIVFKIIKGLSAYDGRREKFTTNGVVFSLSDAKRSGIGGIWKLPLLDDPAEDDRLLEIDFFPEPSVGDFATIQESIVNAEETLFWFSIGRDNTLKVKKLFVFSQVDKNVDLETMGARHSIKSTMGTEILNRQLTKSQFSKSITISKKILGLCLILTLLLGVWIGYRMRSRIAEEKGICFSCGIELEETETIEIQEEGE